MCLYVSDILFFLSVYNVLILVQLGFLRFFLFFSLEEQWRRGASIFKYDGPQAPKHLLAL